MRCGPLSRLVCWWPARLITRSAMSCSARRCCGVCCRASEPRLHRAFAEALQSGPSLSPDRLPPVAQALHWRGAGEHQRALRAAWAAAARPLVPRLPMPSSCRCWSWCWICGSRHPTRAGMSPWTGRGVMEIAADAARLAGEPERGLPLVEAAIGGLDEARDAERAASLLRLRAALRSASAAAGCSSMTCRRRCAWRRALPGCEPTCSPGSSGTCAVRDRNEEARPLAAELQMLAEQLGDEEYRINARIRLAELGGYDIIPVLAEAAEAARRIGSGPQETLARDGITYHAGKARRARGRDPGRAGGSCPGQATWPGPVWDGNGCR